MSPCARHASASSAGTLLDGSPHQVLKTVVHGVAIQPAQLGVVAGWRTDERQRNQVADPLSPASWYESREGEGSEATRPDSGP